MQPLADEHKVPSQPEQVPPIEDAHLLLEEERLAELVKPRPEKAPSKQEKPGENLFYWLQTLVIALVSITLVFTFLGRASRVVGESMVPSLQDGEWLLLWSLGYEPKQGDIIVLNKVTTTFLDGEAIVKRVIATGGQTVDIDCTTDTVYVDGVPLDESYTNLSFPQNGAMGMIHYEVPEGELFVMGDNRYHSTDSRDSRLGTVDQSYILGRAIVVFFPLTHIALL